MTLAPERPDRDAGDGAGDAGVVDPERSTDLATVWSPSPGVWGWLTNVNHKAMGTRFMVTAFVFFLVGGLLALAMRTQLATPEAEVLGPDTYNQAFTLHGTLMLFLFAVPMLEGFAMYVTPLMLGTRDMPFPRLNLFGYYAFLFGGLFVFAGVAAGEVPDDGWFAYLPLTNPEFEPGKGLDYWLLGVTFVEIAGIVGAIELITLIFKHRAPGMALNRMPLFAWAVLAMAFAMLLAFPPLVAASTMLELERSFDLPFFDVERGGDPLLWQHLFWIFGHPEVYIMLLPSVGIVSTVVAATARREIVGYGLVAASLVAIAFVSFGLWVHHMYATGLPLMATIFFTAASTLIAIPSGIQVFAWIGTLWGRRPAFTTHFLFVLGFAAIFVLGGITGVMVAVVPFDWQVHDTYFVVAHFHYVLVGGVVFPIFAGLHYWWPKFSGRRLGESLGRWSFWLMFVGFNVGFFPQHMLGMLGMPRRVYTYRDEDGLGWLNMISTVGAFMLGVGALVFCVNAVRALRSPVHVEDPWEAGTLEWATSSPPPPHNFEHLPVVASTQPRWEWAEPDPDSELAEMQAAMRTAEGGNRETWSTSALRGEVEEIVLIPGPSAAPLVLAAAIVVALAGVLYDVLVLELLGAVVGVVALIAWLWPDRGAQHAEPIDHERPLRPPAPARRPGATVAGVWAVRLAAAAILGGAASFAFGYLYTVTQSAQWPPDGYAVPPWRWIAIASGLAVVTVPLIAYARSRMLGPDQRKPIVTLVGALVAAMAAVVAGVFAVDSWPATRGEHVYGSFGVSLYGIPLVLGAVGVGMLAVVLVREVLSSSDRRPAVSTLVTRDWWCLVAVTWLALGGIAVVVPRALG